MPLGFDPPHPGGMTENSPTFQRWDSAPEGVLVPKGRLKPAASAVPSGLGQSQISALPTLKRWAIVGCPYGTNTYPGLVAILEDQILAALDKNVRAPEKCEMRTSLSFAHLSSSAQPGNIRKTSRGTIRGVLGGARQETIRSPYGEWMR
jgi:hypothetical protein